jgi:hypothetical protein
MRRVTSLVTVSFVLTFALADCASMRTRHVVNTYVAAECRSESPADNQAETRVCEPVYHAMYSWFAGDFASSRRALRRAIRRASAFKLSGSLPADTADEWISVARDWLQLVDQEECDYQQQHRRLPAGHTPAATQPHEEVMPR